MGCTGDVGRGKKGCSWSSVAAVGMRLENWIEREMVNGEGLQVAHLFPCSA